MATKKRKKMAAKKKTASRRKTTAKRAKKKTATKRKKKAVFTLPEVNQATAAVKEKMTQSQILQEIADATELPKNKVKEVLENLQVVSHRHLKKGGVGTFKVPFLHINLKRVKKPARKARKGINPFTGEETTFKAKPATTVVKARPAKALKESIA